MKPNSKPVSVESLFDQAVGFASITQRNEFLEDAFARFPELRDEVEGLIRSHDDAGSFLLDPIVDLLATGDADATRELPVRETPKQIGPYRIIQSLGQGGMGAVYLAEQSEPVRRRVALKLIKPGMDSARVLKRFEAERQALAMMDHSNIAKVFDAGTTSAGHPFFVMELIKGVPITRYCNELNLTLRERLELFIPVCHAIHHAHQKGIIHRDIKPSNVLVSMEDGIPVPKVIDFGIAKAVHQPLSAQTLLTEFGAIIGTLDYMSPEQAELNALDIDTRVDVYSLGVLLYELLTGTTPLDRKNLKNSDLLSVLSMIRERVPPRPSTRLTETKVHLADETRKPNSEMTISKRELRGDLDWIVMKCLEMDRCRRYDSPNQLAEDLERYLNHQPVIARPPSTVYWVQKFCRRRRFLLRVVALVIVMLSISTFFAWQYQLSSADARRERSESDRAQARTSALEELDEVQRLVDQGEFQPAFDTIVKLQLVIGEHGRLAKLRDACSQTWTFSSNQPGTKFWRRDYERLDQPWTLVGNTTGKPAIVQIPRGVYLWKATCDGCRDVVGLRLPGSAHFDLDKEDQLPQEMVRIPAGPAYQPSQAFVFQYGTYVLPSYFFDRNEVSNAEFGKFVAAGGYENSNWWEGLEFIDEHGAKIAREQAMSLFVDTTGKPGPATWENGWYLKGSDEYPVMGVSWYEAMAYARYVDKELPTVYHWETASQHEYAGWLTLGLILDRFHFDEAPLRPSLLRDIGIFGTSGTGGNAKEWTRNATESGERFILGGGCGETLYKVITLDHSRPIRRECNFGFRCMKSIEHEAPELSESFASIDWAAPPTPESLLDKKTFDLAIGDRFNYDHSKSLGVQLEQQDEGKWIHVTASFNAAYLDNEGNPDRVLAHLYLPKSPPPPQGFQTVVYMPPLDAAFLAKIRPLDKEYGLDLIVASGRAVLRPIYAGSFDRKADADSDDDKTLIKIVQDLLRSNDFLVSRDDIDDSGLAFYGFSLGAIYGCPALAIDERFKAAVFQGAGLHITPVSERNIFRESAFTWPRIQIPVLMIGGQDDQIRPIRESQQPMLALLGSHDKQLVVCPGGHMLPAKMVMEKIIPWLDERLGVPKPTPNPR